MKFSFFLGAVLSIFVLHPGQAADPINPSTTPAASGNPQTSTAPAAPANAPQLQTVVVTATRTEVPISKSTASITVIDRDQIDDNQYQTLADALEQVPGLHLANSGTPGQVTGVFLRGTETRHTQIAIDGKIIPADLSGGFDLTNISLDDVERIEVLRGPSSSLYGGSTIGGVINIITRDGRGLKQPESDVSFEAGSFNSFRETLSSRGAVKDFDYSAGLSRLDTTFQRPNNDYRADHANAKLGYQLNADLYADFTMDYRLTNAQNPNSYIADQNAAPTDTFLEETWRVSPEFIWQTNEIWKQKIYYIHSQERQVSLGNVATPPAAFVPPYPQFPSTGSNGRAEIIADDMEYQSDVQVFESWLLTGGVSFTNTSTTFLYDQANDGVTPPGEVYHNGQTNTAPYLQSNWDILKNWNLVQAVRLEHFSDFGDEVTWRSGSSYQLEGTKTNFHASYGTAFTPPADQNYLTFGGTQEPNFNLKPERSRGYDAGVNQPLWQDKINLSATYFHNHLTNYIGSVYDPVNAAFMPVNLLDVVTSGAELGADWKICEQWSMNTNYTYTNADNTSTGVRLVRRPRQVVDFGFTAHPLKSVVLTLGGSWNMQAQDYSAVDFAQVRVPDYFVARATVSWDINESWQVFGRMENLTNDKYEDVPGYPALDQAFYGGFKFMF